MISNFFQGFNFLIQLYFYYIFIMEVVMTFSKKALIGVVLGLMAGATSVCMDKSFVPQYSLTVFKKGTKQKADITLVKTAIKAAGGGYIYDTGTTLKAKLPDQSNVGDEHFIGETIKRLEYTSILSRVE